MLPWSFAWKIQTTYFSKSILIAIFISTGWLLIVLKYNKANVYKPKNHNYLQDCFLRKFSLSVQVLELLSLMLILPITK